LDNALSLTNSDRISVALKEWAIVCKALEEGRQILLLRKGGIMEYKKGFEIKHEKFLLYPTYEHQSSELIQAEYVKNFETVLQNAPEKGTNKITAYAKVIELREINDLKILHKLKRYHIWNDSYVKARMSYNPKKPMSVLLLRVYKASESKVINTRPEWDGCKSWISIGFNLYDNTTIENKEQMQPTYQNHRHQKNHMNKPVLDDAKFNLLASEVLEILR
jgi:hypothetical protein